MGKSSWARGATLLIKEAAWDAGRAHAAYAFELLKIANTFTGLFKHEGLDVLAKGEANRVRQLYRAAAEAQDPALQRALWDEADTISAKLEQHRRGSMISGQPAAQPQPRGLPAGEVTPARVTPPAYSPPPSEPLVHSGPGERPPMPAGMAVQQGFIAQRHLNQMGQGVPQGMPQPIPPGIGGMQQGPR